MSGNSGIIQLMFFSTMVPLIESVEQPLLGTGMVNNDGFAEGSAAAIGGFCPLSASTLGPGKSCSNP